MLAILLLTFLVYYLLGVAFIAKIVIFVAILAILIHLVKNGTGLPGSSRVIGSLIGIIVISLVAAIYYRKGGEEKEDEVAQTESSSQAERQSNAKTIIAPIAPEWSALERTPGQFDFYPENNCTITVRKSDGTTKQGVHRDNPVDIGNTKSVEFQSECQEVVKVKFVLK